MKVTAAVDDIVSTEDASDRLGIGKVFLLKDARREGFGGIVVIDWNCLLQNDHAVIDSFIDKMNTATRNFGAIVKGLLLCVETRKGRQQ